LATINTGYARADGLLIPNFYMVHVFFIHTAGEKGRGLFTTQSVTPGELLLISEPLVTTTLAPIPGSKAARSTIRPIGLVEQLLSKLFNPGQLQWLQELYNGSASKVSSAVQWGMDLLGLQKMTGEGGRLQRAEFNSIQAATILQLNAHTGACVEHMLL
jgi:hypothetical protein